MCDTMCMMPSYSSDGIAYFAKNSDRSPNEPLLTLRIPAASYGPGATVRCTYIEVPQVARTREIIISKPSWMWGAEMGINDARVAIGNEAVFTKAKRGEPSLIGMDLLRLALERAGSAREAAEVIIDLLRQYGQGGDCGFDKEFHYDNSFLIQDPHEAFVLETSGKNYALVEVEDCFAISNRLCVEGEHVEREGLGPGESFTGRYYEPVRSFFAQSKARRLQAQAGLAAGVGAGAAGLFATLRTHAPGLDGKEFAQASVGSVCMHAGGLIGDHATGSMVAVLRGDKPVTVWTTGCSTPCVAAFKPVFWGGEVPPVFADEAASLEYWLQRERLHRAVIADKVDLAALRKRVAQLEQSWLAEEARIMSADTPDKTALAALSARAHAEEQALIDDFSVGDWDDLKGGGLYGRYWRAKNAKLGQPRI